MYPFSGSGHHGQPPYSRLQPNVCSSQTPGMSGLSALVSPLSSFASSFAPCPQSQVLSHQPVYLSHSPLTMGMSDSELGSPTNPISPQESLLDGVNNDRDRGESNSPTFVDFSGYPSPPPPLPRSKPHCTMPASSYYTPSFPFSATPSLSNSTMMPPYVPPPVHPTTVYNHQFVDSNSMQLSANEPHLGLSPYSTLPCMANRMHHQKSISKLSYDSPRFKLTPERAVPLIKWFDEHKDHPYPTRHEKILLCQTTQLTFTQVSTWFANARRRMKKATLEDEETRSSSPCSSPEYKEASSPANSPQELTINTDTVSASSTVHTISMVDHHAQSVKKKYGTDETSPATYWDTTAVY